MTQAIKTNKKILILIGVIISSFLVEGYLYLLNHPPLSWTENSSNDDNTTVTVNIQNDGLTSVEIIDVFVNGTNVTKSAELGISYSGKIVQIKDEPEYNVVFVSNFEEHVIYPTDSIYEAIHKNEPTSYGIRIIHHEPIGTIKIKYKYLGLSWEFIKNI
ncbi:hypothetical protein [Chengkuizengella axinellae]|uniref:Uncharacterized protein n=1 Tax=Chengkuizengella axinellae TaxID=3064388 RepID=A0ABT9J4K1_9BACL|nr:hypothetical protein [Chengkuizengella sp. 2205SS18-9]MDP5275910.1 hypothetical protein [Chengkuizengella sp. 2205SS18-9]